jgi:hypothetical protein
LRQELCSLLGRLEAPVHWVGEAFDHGLGLHACKAAARAYLSERG